MRITQDNLQHLHSADIVDVNGDSLGGVGQVYLDDRTGDPAWVTAKTGFFGTKETFVPLAEADLEGDRLRVPYEKSFIKDAPNMDADQHLDDPQQEELYRYYGLAGGAVGSGVTGGTTGGSLGGGTLGDDSLGDDTVIGGSAGDDATYDRDRGVSGDLGRDLDVDRDRDLDLDRGTDSGDRMTLHEERVDVGTERVESGRVRLRKHVVTDTETVTVPVEREEYELVREPVADGTSAGRSDLGDDEIEVTTYEERPVVDKNVVATEQVGVERHTETDQRQVTTDVSHEEVELEEDGRRDSSDTYAADRDITDPDDPSRRL
ncbi:DUF2382 domain-containing protein [Ornithinimicrobium cerasi]|uniref:Conserved domain-containing protein n=1 Tax=Ornithinimicrobium cerasi TaxID=2248773 RepID=A0A285VGC9_9MICO|nr:PRC and DUF2382 domain-containing protein [Ornithinimicrobium cerasi]SOC52176.1 conserved domain-containing protein [Ornithinimicrobium cerasi]